MKGAGEGARREGGGSRAGSKEGRRREQGEGSN